MPEPRFEDTLGQLEGLVKQLERGDLPLEDALRVFEDGVRLSRQCLELLQAAERKVEMLVEDERGLKHPEPYQPRTEE